MDGIGQMAADFVEIAADGVVKISVWNLQNGTVVGIRNNSADIYQLQDSSTTINVDDYDHVYLIVLNLDRAKEIDDCEMTQYRVNVLRGEEPVMPDQILEIKHFNQPSVEPLKDPDSK